MNRMIAVAIFWLGCAVSANAEPITYLHNFSSDVDHGLGPLGGVAIANGRLFGTTGSNSSGGTIFSMSVDGSDYQILHDFPIDGSDGLHPNGKPIVVGNSVYGVTDSSFAPHQGGTIWAIDTDGSNFRLVHSFGDGSGGAGAIEGMHLIDNRLYGTTNAGGSAAGVLYSLNLDGSDYRVLHDFSDVDIGTQGRRPVAAPIQVGTRLYGTAGGGGLDGGGIVYSIKPDGTDFQLVHSFPTAFTATAGVVAIGDRLFGATTGGGSGGGQNGRGTVYGVNTDGSDFELLHEFNGIDGSQASRDLVTDGARLFGTTFLGGADGGLGVAYSLNVDGSDFGLLHTFHDAPDGRIPNALILENSVLYGTTRGGGLYGGGVVFAISVPEPTAFSLAYAGTVVGLCYLVFAFIKSREENDEQQLHVSSKRKTSSFHND